MSKTHHLQLMQGFGDTVYTRPFVAAAAARGEACWLQTSWPQIFLGIDGVQCVLPRTRLRTQAKNVENSLNLFVNEPRPKPDWRHLSYALKPPRDSITATLERYLPLGPDQTLTMDLPDFGPPPVTTDKPYVVVRPATVRREWRADNRNPLPGYLRDVCRMLADDYELIGVADFALGREEPVEPLPLVHRAFYYGELSTEQLLALVQGAAAVVGPIGWVVPATIATKTPLLCIAGGQGGYHSPARLVDKRLEHKRLRFVLPDNYCRCSTWTHECDRRITRIEDHLESWRLENDL